MFDDDTCGFPLQLGQDVLVGARNHLHSHVVHVLDLTGVQKAQKFLDDLRLGVLDDHVLLVAFSELSDEAVSMAAKTSDLAIRTVL